MVLKSFKKNYVVFLLYCLFAFFTYDHGFICFLSDFDSFVRVLGCYKRTPECCSASSFLFDVSSDFICGPSVFPLFGFPPPSLTDTPAPTSPEVNFFEDVHTSVHLHVLNTLEGIERPVSPKNNLKTVVR